MSIRIARSWTMLCITAATALLAHEARAQDSHLSAGMRLDPNPHGPCVDPNSAYMCGQAIATSDARFYLVMQTDGNLVLYEAGTSSYYAIWASNTYTGYPTNYAVMQSDGNFVVYNYNNVPQWNSGTSGYPNAFLSLQSDGNLVVYYGHTPLWASDTCCRAMPVQPPGCGVIPKPATPTSFPGGGYYGLRPGGSVSSCNGSFQLIMQTDGNLVLYKVNPRTPLWWSGFGSGQYAVLEPDGNFMVYIMDNPSSWATGTNGNWGAQLYVQDDGNLVLYSASGAPIWASNTGP